MMLLSDMLNLINVSYNQYFHLHLDTQIPTLDIRNYTSASCYHKIQFWPNLTLCEYFEKGATGSLVQLPT